MRRGSGGWAGVVPDREPGGGVSAEGFSARGALPAGFGAEGFCGAGIGAAERPAGEAGPAGGPTVVVGAGRAGNRPPSPGARKWETWFGRMVVVVTRLGSFRPRIPA